MLKHLAKSKNMCVVEDACYWFSMGRLHSDVNKKIEEKYGNMDWTILFLAQIVIRSTWSIAIVDIKRETNNYYIHWNRMLQERQSKSMLDSSK